MFLLKNQKRSISFYLTLLLILVGMGIATWKCGVGIGLYDEPYIVAPGFKMLGLGDKPFVDEMMNGARHHDLLNHYFVRPFVRYSLKSIRVHAIACYSIALFFLITVAFGFQLPILGGFLFFILLVFDGGLLTSTWSYNTWPRFGILIHHAFLLLIPSFQRKIQPWLLFAAGFFLAIAGLAHFAVLIGIGIAFLLLALYAYLWTGFSKSQFRLYLPYLAGIAVPIVIDALYIIVSGVSGAWYQSILLTIHGSPHAAGGFLQRILDLTRTILFPSKVELVLFLGIFGTSISKNPTARKISWVCTALFIIRFLTRLWGPPIPNLLWVNACLVSLIVISIILLLLEAHRTDDLLLLWLTLASVVTMGTMAYLSTMGVTALLWIAPSLLILGGTIWSLDRKVVLIVFGCLTIASARVAFTTTYYDSPPSECTTVMTISPFQGIRTSERRAFLIEKVSKVLNGKKFAFGYPLVTWPFLMGEVRSSIPTVGGGINYEESVYADFIRQMNVRKRFPELIIHHKQHAWYWGVSPAGKQGILGDAYKMDEPRAFVQYRKKHGGRVLLNLPELEVVENVQLSSQKYKEK